MKFATYIGLLGLVRVRAAGGGGDDVIHLKEDEVCYEHQDKCKLNLACAVNIDVSGGDGTHKTSLCVPKETCGSGGVYVSITKGKTFVMPADGTCITSKYNTAFDFVYGHSVPISDVFFNEGSVGYLIEGDFDVSAGYAFPWYSDGYYVGFDAAPNLRFGGDIHFQFDMYFMKLHFWIAMIFADLQIINLFLSYNTKTYVDACMALYSTLSNFYFDSTIEIDFMKCWFGFIGVFIDDPFDCEFKEYAITDVGTFGLS